jgi:hypothetical protein
MATKEELKTIISDGSLSVEERDEATRLLAELEKKKQPENFVDLFAKSFDKSKEDYAAWVADQNVRFKVCGSCYRKQLKGRESCELCGAAAWQLAVVDSSDGRHSRLIWAATEATGEQLNAYVEHTSIDTDYVQHCAKVLELRGIPRVRSFWERAGFTMLGRPIQA